MLKRIAFPLLLMLVAIDAIAESCDTDCHRQCRIRLDIPPIEFIEPACHSKCEIAKHAACLIRADIPTVPITALETTKQASKLACSDLFMRITHATIAYCANWPGRADDLFQIENAKHALVLLKFATIEEFNGIDIRWCPVNGSGMAPDAGRILIHPDLKNDQRELTSTLGHELQHMRQYQRWSADDRDFKCRYSLEMAAGKWQGRSNEVENEAYIKGDEIKAAWDKQVTSKTISSALTNNQEVMVTTFCADPRGCAGILGTGIFIESSYAEHEAKMTCTLGEELDSEIAKSCITYMGDIYKVILAMSQSDPDEGDDSAAYNTFLNKTYDWRVDACNKLQDASSDKVIAKTWTERCVVNARNTVFKIFELAKLDKLEELEGKRKSLTLAMLKEPNQGKVRRISKDVVEESVDAKITPLEEKKEIITAVEKAFVEELGHVDGLTFRYAIAILRTYMKGKTHITLNLGKDSSGRDYVLFGTIDNKNKYIVSFGVHELANLFKSSL